jgi:hypothetical protein
MTRSWRSGVPAALALGTLVGCGAQGRQATTAAVPPARALSPSFSPYVDVTLGGGAGAGLAAQTQAAGLRSVTLAFVDGRRGSCRATWGGRPLGSAFSAGDARALRAAGAALVVSFGGRDGLELAQTCPGAAALSAQYQAVVDAYHPARLDFDVEGAAVGDAAANARRWTALLTVLARAARGGAAPAVSLTLPAGPGGLDGSGIAFVRGALAAGVRPAQVNLLAMDYGPGFSGSGVSMSAYAERAAGAASRQLRAFSGAGYGRLGLTVMVGANDTAGETFTLADARTVSAFATGHGVGGLSMWSLGRDRPCPRGSAAGAQPTCSGVAQSPLAFARALGR